MRPAVPAWLRCATAAASLAAAHAAAWAQPTPVPAPDAGRILQETTPALPPPAPAEPPQQALPPASPPPAPPRDAAPAVSFVLRGVRISGNTVFPESALEAYAADRIGTIVNFGDLQQVAQRITEHYRRAGYFLAQAILPPQQVVDGIVRISMVEGRLGRVRIEQAPETPVPQRRVEGMLARLPTGRPLRAQQLEHALLVVSDLPGAVVRSSLEAGEEPGVTDLVVEVAPSRRWDFSVDADNFGSRAVGEYRIGLLGRVRSPLGLGDNADVRLLRSSGGGLTFGRLGYELPVGTAGTRAGLGLAQVRYALGGDFAALGGTGTADIADLTVTHPLIRSRLSNLVLRGGVAVKRLQDRLGAFDLVTDKALRSLNAGATWEARDALLGGGYTSASIAGYLGDLDIGSDAARAADQAGTGRHTNGRFARAAYQLSRLQSLTRRTSVFAGLAGQFASRNLDSAEKIALGGPTAVRAYPISEAIVDTGHVLNLELRASARHDLSLSAFYDAAWGDLNKVALPGEDSRRVLRGYGFGLYWNAPAGFTLRASLAWRQTGPALSDSRDAQPRLFAQLIKTF